MIRTVKNWLAAATAPPAAERSHCQAQRDRAAEELEQCAEAWESMADLTSTASLAFSIEHTQWMADMSHIAMHNAIRSLELASRLRAGTAEPDERPVLREAVAPPFASPRLGQETVTPADSFCEGCGAGVDQRHLAECSVWRSVLQQGH